MVFDITPLGAENPGQEIGSRRRGKRYSSQLPPSSIRSRIRDYTRGIDIAVLPYSLPASGRKSFPFRLALNHIPYPITRRRNVPNSCGKQVPSIHSECPAQILPSGHWRCCRCSASAWSEVNLFKAPARSFMFCFRHATPQTEGSARCYHVPSVIFILVFTNLWYPETRMTVLPWKTAQKQS